MEAKGLFEVKVVCDFSAAHMLRNFKGKCEHLHGHNWKIEVVIRGSRLNERTKVKYFWTSESLKKPQEIY